MRKRAAKRRRAAVAERCGLPPGAPPQEPSEIADRAVTLYYEVFGRLATLALQE